MFMYHVSPVWNRESILQGGLDPSYFASAEPVVYLDAENKPSANPDALDYYDVAEHDVYEVNVAGLTLDSDPELPGRWFTFNGVIKPSRLRLLT